MIPYSMVRHLITSVVVDTEAMTLSYTLRDIKTRVIEGHARK